MEIEKPVDFTFYTSGNKAYNWTLLTGTLPEGIVFDRGRITGVPVKAGIYKISFSWITGR